MQVMKIIFTQPQKKLSIEFFKQKFFLKTTLTALFFVEKQTALSFIVWGEKNKFVQLNLLVEIFLFVCVFLNKKYSHTHSTYVGG